MVRMTATIFFLSRTLFSTHGKPLAYNLLFYLYLYHEDLPQVLQFISIWHAKSLYVVFFFPNKNDYYSLFFLALYSARIANLHVNSFSCRIIPRKILLNSRTLALSYLARTEILHITSLQVRMTITALLFLVFYSARGENLQIKTFSYEHYVTQYLL